MVELLNEPFGDFIAPTLTLVWTATFTCVLAGWRCPASRARRSTFVGLSLVQSHNIERSLLLGLLNT